MSNLTGDSLKHANAVTTENDMTKEEQIASAINSLVVYINMYYDEKDYSKLEQKREWVDQAKQDLIDLGIPVKI